MEDVQHSKGPGGSQHEQQGQGTTGTGPGGDQTDFNRVWEQCDTTPYQNNPTDMGIFQYSFDLFFAMSTDNPT